MRKKIYAKGLLLFLIVIFFASFVFAFNPFEDIRSPSDLLENDWFIFIVIFLIVFAFVFISLSNVFVKKTRNAVFPWITEKKFHKAPVIIISVCIALLTAAAIMRRDLIYSYLGKELGVWVFAMLLIIFAVLTIPFYKFLKLNLGGMAGMAFAGVLAAAWIALNTADIYDIFPSEMVGSNLEEIYEFITTKEVLYIIIGFGILSSIWGWIKKKSS